MSDETDDYLKAYKSSPGTSTATIPLFYSLCIGYLK